MRTQLVCKICGKPGHLALDCYQRMNLAYEGRILAKCLTAMATSPTTMTRQNNGTWLLDTGANAHVTPELQNLVNPKEYTGNDNVGGVGKSKTLPFSKSDSVSSSPLELVHSDVWSSPIVSVNGYRYYLLYVDDFSRYTWIFPMKHKFEDLTSSEGGVSTTGIQSHPNVLFTFPEFTNSIGSLPSNSLPAQSLISPNSDLVVMPHDPSHPHNMPILPSTEQESVQHNDHASDEPDVSSPEVSRLFNVPTHPMVTRS
ncbi:hypothetical protein L3X38_032511 [Prunus dulcis]|uniref:CCHC-type domain-containing protein n=1 Tax=Prunus dulcis TaxID=3755 RepID=A0AAD4YW42_PRUDU|nr:hypothetical protein L3X38_032511 [Prunus dulcis]